MRTGEAEIGGKAGKASCMSILHILLHSEESFDPRKVSLVCLGNMSFSRKLIKDTGNKLFAVN